MQRKEYIRAKIREIGRVLIELRKRIGGGLSVRDCIRPSCFRAVVAAVKAVAGHNEHSGTYKTPSLYENFSIQPLSSEFPQDIIADNQLDKI